MNFTPPGGLKIDNRISQGIERCPFDLLNMNE